LEEKQMKKTLIILLALVMVSALLTGCGNQKDVSTNDSTDQEPVFKVSDGGENARISGGGAFSYDIPIDTEGLTLDDINMLEGSDSGASFKGSSWNMDGLVSAAGR